MIRHLSQTMGVLLDQWRASKSLPGAQLCVQVAHLTASIARQALSLEAYTHTRSDNSNGLEWLYDLSEGGARDASSEYAVDLLLASACVELLSWDGLLHTVKTALSRASVAAFALKRRLGDAAEKCAVGLCVFLHRLYNIRARSECVELLHDFSWLLPHSAERLLVQSMLQRTAPDVRLLEVVDTHLAALTIRFIEGRRIDSSHECERQASLYTYRTTGRKAYAQTDKHTHSHEESTGP
jgi:hypothetical protein